MPPLAAFLHRLPRALRRFRVAIVVAAALGVFACTQTKWFAGFAPIQQMELKHTDWRFHGRGNRSGSPEIAIIGVTNSSVDPEGLKDLAPQSEAIALMASKPWPWNRKVFAILIERLLQSGARVVALDLIFPGERDGNAELAEVVAKYPGRVVLGSTKQIQETEGAGAVQTFILPDLSIVPEGMPNTVAFCFLPPDPDGVIRRVDYRTSERREYGLDDDSQTLISLGGLAVQQFTGRPAPSGYGRLISYQGPQSTFAYYPMEEVLADSIFLRDPRYQGGQRFKDKLVIIGPISEVQFHDVHNTPFGPMPGVEIHAQIASALLQEASLRETSPFTNLWITLLCAAVPTALVLLIRQALWQVAALLGAAVLYVVVIGQWLFNRAELLLPFTAPVFALVVTGGFGVVFHFLLEQFERAWTQSTLDETLARQRALEKAQEQVAAELEEAAAYVRSLLPEPLSGPADSEWRFIPSTALGGDSFGHHWIDDDHLAVYLLDVVGHGIPAALMSVAALNQLRSQTLPETDFKDPGQVLSALNRAFQMEAQNEKYFTIWYGVFDRTTRELAYAAGGHPPALLWSGASPETAELRELRGKGLMIGAMPDLEYATERCTLGAFARLYLFSDGIYEVMQPDGSTWRISDFSAYLQAHRLVTSALDRIIEDMRKLQGNVTFEDDVSLLTVHFPATP